jgi:quercetin dioxygenase-like cupin family protein
VIMDVTLEPGEGHDFHKHPGQEEMIIVKQGEITQYVERESTSLGAGDSVYLDEGVVHASFNDSTATAHLQVVIGPSLGGETGYGLEDVSGEEPWASLRS